MTNGIKVGDTVRVSKDAPRMYVAGLDYVFVEAESEVVEVEDGNATIEVNERSLTIPLKYLVKVGGEEKEPRFKVGDKVIPKLPFAKKILTVLGYDDKTPCLVMIGEGEFINEKHLEPYTEPTEKKDSTITIPVKAEIDDSFWDAFTAELAKEIITYMLRQGGRIPDFDELMQSAIRAAKSVVEELKKK